MEIFLVWLDKVPGGDALSGRLTFRGPFQPAFLRFCSLSDGNIRNNKNLRYFKDLKILNMKNKQKQEKKKGSGIFLTKYVAELYRRRRVSLM